MTMTRVLHTAAALALAGLALTACHKREQAGTAPGASSTTAPGGPSAANDRAGNDGDLQGGETMEGGPAMISEDAFLAQYRQLAGVTVTQSGLMYRVIENGPAGGKSPTVTDKVTVQYKGAFMDGSLFDQSANASFTLSDTIEGWRQALPLMKVGDRWEIVIPSALAYGEKGAKDPQTGQQVVPPNSPLIFEIKLLGVG